MAVTAVVGAQWGDEGKGRVVDYLAQRAQMVIRFQGGDNAGHTVVNDIGEFALHMIPSGIFNPDTVCVVGAGTVVNPANLLGEMKMLREAGLKLENLVIDRRAHVVLPYHPELDALREAARAQGDRIGTTKRGIGPAYADKAARTGIRMGDLLRPEYLRSRLEQTLPSRNRLLADFDRPQVELEALLSTCDAWRDALGDRIVDTLPLVKAAVTSGQSVLLEGQLGVMRDLDWGIYPYVTSSNPTVGAASNGAGLPPTAIDGVLGVVKAYSTSVGGGPFPCELHDEQGQKLRDIGHEYGATTGRPRRCGWFDGIAIRHAAWLNGFTGLAVTKMDILDHFDEIQLCIGYRVDGELVETMPDTPELFHVEPVYETWPGWDKPTSEAREWDELPQNAQKYLNRISELAEVPIHFVSVGPAREELVVLQVSDSDGVQ